MSLRIASNIDALSTYKNLSATQSKLSSSIEKLSSGYRINSASDDAAGLAISQSMASKISGNTQAIQNAQDGTSMAQTAEGSLTEIQSILQRARDLTVQAANGTNSTSSLADIKAEVDQLSSEASRISKVSNFNGTSLLNSTGTVTFQVGADGGEDNQISMDMGKVGTATSLAALSGLASALASAISSGSFAASASSAQLNTLDGAIQDVSTSRAYLGATENRLDHTINNLTTTVQNLTASKSRITDTDMASEMMNYSSASVLSQAGTAMLAQANQLPNSVLKLLG